MLLASALAGAPQEGREALLVVRLGIDLVQVDAVVTDKKGRAVTGLVAADFEILQDGCSVPVAEAVYMGSAAGAGAAPRAAAQGPGEPEAAMPEAAMAEVPSDAIVFVVDDLSMSLSGVDATRRALLGFADAMEQGAQVFLLRTACGCAVDIQPLGGAGEVAGRGPGPAVPGVAGKHDVGPGKGRPFALPALRPGHEPLPEPAPGPSGSLLSLQDITDALRSWKGRKTLVLFSEGFPLWDPTNRERFASLDLGYEWGEDVLDDVDCLTDLANRASVVMHTVDTARPRSHRHLRPGRDDDVPLHGREYAAGPPQRIPYDPGQPRPPGRTDRRPFGDENSNDLGSGLARIVSDSRSYYLIGYEPTPETFGRGPSSLPSTRGEGEAPRLCSSPAPRVLRLERCGRGGPGPCADLLTSARLAGSGSMRRVKGTVTRREFLGTVGAGTLAGPAGIELPGGARARTCCSSSRTTSATAT